MSVRDFYYQHFQDLTPDKQFHFATRIKNYFHSDDFAEYFQHNMPSTNLRQLLQDNDFSRVRHLEARRPFFEKYDHVFAIEATLFRIHHLLNEYGIDLRPEFIKLLPLDQLYALSDALLADNEAILVLSTWAVNVICLTEHLFPRGHNVVHALGEKAFKLEPEAHDIDPALLIYLYTHIILCDSNFYTRPISEVGLAHKMLDRCAAIIEQNFDTLFLDPRLEFLVCSDMAQVNFSSLRLRIADECRQILQHNPYLISFRRPKTYHTLDKAEHMNVLFIMSGLDAELSSTT